MTIRPFLFPDLYAAIIVGTEVSPGKVTLSGHDRDQDWEVKKAKGSQGASTLLRGRKPAEFQASFELTSDTPNSQTDDFARWDRFQRVLESTVAGTEPVALPIYHPDLARNGITDIVLESMGGMRHDSRGGATIVVKLREYAPPKPKAATKARPKPGADGKASAAGSPPARRDPNADAKKELSELLNEAKSP